MLLLLAIPAIQQMTGNAKARGDIAGLVDYEEAMFGYGLL